jgi:hypothetical protein
MMTKKDRLKIRNSIAEFLIFTSQAKEDGIEVRVEDDTVWLSQKRMAVLFDCSTDLENSGFSCNFAPE